MGSKDAIAAIINNCKAGVYDEETAAERIMTNERVYAHFEQKIANDTVRESKKTGYCRTCGAEVQ